MSADPAESGAATPPRVTLQAVDADRTDLWIAVAPV
jgi:hypothetical protein